jgi:cytochrome c
MFRHAPDSSQLWSLLGASVALALEAKSGLLAGKRAGIQPLAHLQPRCRPSAWSALAASLLLGTAAHASPELAQSSRCLACHQVDRKVVGPAFREVARRYAGRPDAAAHLARKIREGGSGAWGAVPMAANPHVSEADATRLAQWVLTLK